MHSHSVIYFNTTKKAYFYALTADPPSRMRSVKVTLAKTGAHLRALARVQRAVKTLGGFLALYENNEVSGSIGHLKP